MSRETQILALANAVAQALGSRAVYVPAPAQAISYSSAVSGLGANNVQDAVDAVRTLATVQSINGKTGTPVLTAADVGADPTGTAAAALTAHVTGPDPHPQYAPKINPSFTGMAQVQNFKATGTSYFNGDFYIYSRPNVVNATANAWVTMPRIFVQAGDPGNAASDGDLWIW